MPYGGTTPEQDKKIERCVKRVLSNPDFKPQDEKQTKESAAIAICKSAIMKADEDFEDNMFINSKDAQDKAKILGCSGTHTAELMGDTYFMPCATHEELMSRIRDEDSMMKANVKGENKMVEENKDISRFSDESVIKKVEDLIKKLEDAKTIEDAKSIIPELKALVPEKKPEEKPAEEPAKPAEVVEPAMEKNDAQKQLEEVAKQATNKEEIKDAKGQESKGQETKTEAKAEEVKTEEKSEVKDNASLSEVLDLNDKLIVKLKESLDEKTKLETEIVSYKKQIEDLTTTIAKYKEVENKEAETKRLEKFNKVFDNYVNFFKVETKDVDVIKRQMSSFSEDVLEQINSYMDKKKIAEMKDEPVVVTQPSSQLSEGKSTEEKEKIFWDDLTPKEKTRFLFEKVKELSK